MAKVIADLVARGASPAFIRVVAAVVTPQAMRLLNDKFPGTLPSLARRVPHLCHTQPWHLPCFTLSSLGPSCRTLRLHVGKMPGGLDMQSQGLVC